NRHVLETSSHRIVEFVALVGKLGEFQRRFNAKRRLFNFIPLSIGRQVEVSSRKRSLGLARSKEANECIKGRGLSAAVRSNQGGQIFEFKLFRFVAETAKPCQNQR